MNVIYTNSTNTNILNNNSNTITSLSNQQTTKEISNNTDTNPTNKIDSIEISEKDANKINKKKAFDAFKDSLSTLDSERAAHISAYFNVVAYSMKSAGISVPSFNISDNTNSTGFLSFIDKMKDFVKTANITDRNGVTIDQTSFLDFCDIYKEKLNQYGCE